VSEPHGWSTVPLGDVVDVVRGVTFRRDERRDAAGPGVVACLRTSNVQYDLETGDLAFIPTAKVRSDQQMVRSGDLIVSMSNSFELVGKAAIAKAEHEGATFGAFLAALRSDAIAPRYLLWLFRSAEFGRRLRNSASQTVNIANISVRRMGELEVAVPPAAEQRRIAAKIDSLTGKSNRTREHLDHVPRLVEKYKQAVLAAAFRGDFTWEWRGTNTGHLDGPSDLSSFALDDSERGRWPSEVLPDQWEWRPFNEVFVDLTDSTRKLPQKDYLPEGPFPVVDQGADIVGGFTDRADLVHLAAPPFIVFGDHTRCVKYVDTQFVQGADGVKVLHTVDDVLRSYGRLALLAVDLPDKGYSRHMKFVRSTLFPVAPLPEQNEIVERVKSAFARIDRLSSEATSARLLVDHLDQAVLAKAFRGELVPQDPADEPASVLLERIGAEREASPKAKRGRKKVV